MKRTEKPFLYVAMDFMEEDLMLYWAEKFALVEGNFGFKVNDDYLNKYTAERAVNELKGFNRQIFADKKMFKGVRRMINSALELSTIGGVEFTNVFALVGQKMLNKVVDGVQGSGIDILALTILTHMDENYCKQMFRRSLSEAVRMFAQIAKDAGCPGIILPGTCLKYVEDFDLIKVVPGIRPKQYQGGKANPQSQIVTPGQAVRDDADILVAGSPIFDTENPVDSLKRILEEMDI